MLSFILSFFPISNPGVFCFQIAKDSTLTSASFSIGSSSSTFGTLSTNSDQVAPGDVVSLTSDGILQKGAGTTIFKNIFEVTQDCPKFLGADSIFEDVMMTTYVNRGDLSTTFNVFEIESDPRSSTQASTQTSTYNFYEIRILDKADGFFIGITQDVSFGGTEETSYVIAGKVDKTTYAITLGTPVVYGSLFSLAPRLVRVSDTSFALAYYDDNPLQVNMKYGSIDVDTLAIDLSGEYPFANNTNYATNMNLVTLDEETIMFLYTEEAKNLNAKIGKFVFGTDGTFSGIDMSAAFVLPEVEMQNYIIPTKIDNTTVVLAFDESTDSNVNGISAIVLKATARYNADSKEINEDSTVIFGDKFRIMTGQTKNDILSFPVIDLDIVTISNDGQFAVSFSDIRNEGRVTVMTALVDAVGNIVRTSPDFAISDATPSLNDYFWNSISALHITPDDISVGIVSSRTDDVCNSNTSSFVHVMQIKPTALGVVSKAASSGDYTVALHGSYTMKVSTLEASDTDKLTPGKIYYGTTIGSLVGSYRYVGSMSSTNGYLEVEDSDGTSLIVADRSIIGLASGSETLILDVRA